MSRQQDSKGVILTGYFSNSEVVPPLTGLNNVEDSESPALRRSGHYSVQAKGKHGPTPGLSPAPGSSPILKPTHLSPASNSTNISGQGSTPSCKLPYQRCNSQDSLDELAMDDYWKEVEHISSSRGGEGAEGAEGAEGGEGEAQEEVQLKVPEEGEQEEAWLEEAGLAMLFDDSSVEKEDSLVLLSTLTRTQVAAVERRLTSLTLRKRKQTHHVPDVRDIFRQGSKEQEAPPTAGSETRNEEASSAGVDQGRVEAETDLNLEVSFSEQALSYREGSKVAEEASCDTDDQLPNFKVIRDKTGLTKVGDLSPQDMKKVHRLVLIEMTALYDTAGIDLKAHKAVKLKVKEWGLFGVPLVTLLEQDQGRAPGTRVPIILQRLINHIEEEGLDTEGLLRIPGSATRVKAVCQDLEANFYEGVFPWETLKQHDAASVLKLFIRELPHPLLTVEYLNAFIAVLKLPTKKQQLQALNLLVLLLPEANRDTLKTLMEFFQRVIDHKDQNKMTLNNVSVVMAPNIFMFKGFRSKISEQQEFSMATGIANIVRLLIRYQNLLWTIPNFIMNQVRKQNAENQRKTNKDHAMRKILRRMAYDRDKSDKPDRGSAEQDSVQGFIRVQAPQFSKVSMAVQLTEKLQAADVLTRFLSQDSCVSVKREDLCLYEIGGNIKERCLDEETYMKDLQELNPSAEWVIKAALR
ncbi:rho GTPase-activating protein 18 isoform X3 [Osmerus eperlanus]|uniref:rho GTPase-activating protein 18 isoform X3 n=1 Tax=Osmerus eperlanus TaxID=29151 RepID=UPI002E0D1763